MSFCSQFKKIRKKNLTKNGDKGYVSTDEGEKTNGNAERGKQGYVVVGGSGSCPH